MNEREELLTKIAACSAVMEKVKGYEDCITGLQDKKRKVKGVGAFVLMFVLFMLVGGLLTGLTAVIPLIGSVMVIICLLATFAGPFVLRSIIAKKLDREITEYENLLVDTQSDELLNWLPPAYRNFVSYSYITSYIQNMRANNLQEALNLFETEKHRATLEYLAATSSKIVS